MKPSQATANKTRGLVISDRCQLQSDMPQVLFLQAGPQEWDALGACRQTIVTTI
jgi:hypothetical protein